MITHEQAQWVVEQRVRRVERLVDELERDIRDAVERRMVQVRAQVNLVLALHRR